MIRRPPRSTQSRSSAASDVYKRQVEGGAAPEDPVAALEDLQPLAGGGVPAVEDEPVRVDDRRRTDVAAVDPINGAGPGAGGAQDALGGVVVAVPLLLSL